jgi:hypothetical protein
MNWKILLFIFLITFLAGMIYFKPLKLPSFSLTGFLYKVVYSQNQANFKLFLDSINKEQTLQLTNTTFLVDGTCITPIKINKLSIQIAYMPCNIEMYYSTGTIKLNGNNAYIEASSPLIKINDIEYVSDGKISFKISINSLSAQVSAKYLNFENFKGRLEKISNNDVSTIINFPPCESVDIYDFSGSLQISNQTILFGNAIVNYWCKNVKKNL